MWSLSLLEPTPLWMGHSSFFECQGSLCLFLLSLPIFVLMPCLLDLIANLLCYFFCTFTSRVKFDGSSSMVTSRNFAILIKFYFNSSLELICTSTYLVKFDCNPSMATFYTNLLSFIPSLKAFELEFNHFRKHWNVLRLVSCSKDNMLRKLIYMEQKELWIVLNLPKRLWICCNFLHEKCAHNWRGIYEVWALGGSLMFQF
jgi:hypothetical protein